MAEPYLNWWMAGLALGGLAAVQWLIERRTVGVSGFVQRTLQVFERPALMQQESRVIHADPERLRAALLQATADEIGGEPSPADPVATEPRSLARRLVTTRGALMYVAAMVLGSAIATVQRGDWSLRTSLGSSFEALWGNGALAVLALFGGGVIVGIGTRMAGGCTSGHGLSGCSRFQFGSLVSTGTFMAFAVATTFLLRGLG